MRDSVSTTPDLAALGTADDVYAGAHPQEEAEINQRLYDVAKDAQRKWADQAVKDLEYYGGAHWTADQRLALEARGQQPTAIQTTFQIVEQSVGMLTTNRPSFRASPREGGDSRTATVWSDIFQWMWYKSRGQQRVTSIVRDYSVQSRGVAYAYRDPNEDFGRGEVLFTDLDPKEVFPDPRCTDPLWDDAAYVLVRRLLTLAQIEMYWPGKGLEVLERGSQNYTEELPYATTNQGLHSEHLTPYDINDPFSRRRYECIERYQIVRRPYYRLFNPHTANDEILSEEQYAKRREDPAFVVIERGMERVIVNTEAVALFAQLYQEFGRTYHLMPAQPTVGPDGQLQEGEPQRMPGEEHMGSLPGSQVDLIPMTVATVIDQGLLPLSRFLRPRVRATASAGGKVMLYPPRDMPISHYPVVPFSNGTNRTPYGISDITRIRDLQDIINKTQSLVLAHQANSTNQKVFYPDGSIRDVATYEEAWGRAGTGFIPYDPMFGVGGGTPGGIVIAQMPPLPNSLFANIDRAISLMERILGVYSYAQGDAGAIPDRTTFRGTIQMDEFAMRRMKYKLDTLYPSLQRLGQVMLEYAQETYTHEKVIRLINSSGTRSESTINQLMVDDYSGEIKHINDITVGHYDVIIIPGSTLPSNRWARMDSYLQLFDRGLVDDIAVLKESEIPDAEAILERKSIYSQLQQAIGGYEEQVKTLQGDLQTWEREAMHAKQRAELEKFKRQLASFGSEIKSAKQLFDNNMRHTVDKARLQAQMQEQKKQKEGADA